VAELTEPEDIANIKKHLGSREIPTNPPTTTRPAASTKAAAPRSSPRLAATPDVPAEKDADTSTMNARQRRDAARAAKTATKETPAKEEPAAATEAVDAEGLNARQRRDAKRVAKNAAKAEAEPVASPPAATEAVDAEGLNARERRDAKRAAKNATKAEAEPAESKKEVVTKSPRVRKESAALSAELDQVAKLKAQVAALEGKLGEVKANGGVVKIGIREQKKLDRKKAWQDKIAERAAAEGWEDRRKPEYQFPNPYKEGETKAGDAAKSAQDASSDSSDSESDSEEEPPKKVAKKATPKPSPKAEPKKAAPKAKGKASPKAKAKTVPSNKAPVVISVEGAPLPPPNMALLQGAQGTQAPQMAPQGGGGGILPPDPAEWPEQYMVQLTRSHQTYAANYNFEKEKKDETWLESGVGRGVQKLIGLDCEMVQTEESSRALVRVSAVDSDGNTLIHTFVKPTGKVVDYRTEVTGITEKDIIDAPYDFTSVQEEVVRLLPPGSILVGHGLYHDLKAMQIDHPKVIDTALIFKFVGETTGRLKPSLAHLCAEVLKKPIRSDPTANHDSIEDAQAALDLVLHAVKHGLPMDLEAPEVKVDPEDLKKLFVHRVPAGWPSACLSLFFDSKHQPTSFDEVKVGTSGMGSTHALFNSAADADAAFEAIKGNLENDASGKAQKTILLPDGSSKISVRKMFVEPATGRGTKRDADAGAGRAAKRTK